MAMSDALREALVNGSGRDPRLAGFIVWCSGLTDEFLHLLVPSLAATQARVALFDIAGRPEVRALMLASHRIVGFELDKSGPGASVGRHLLSMGHTGVAFVSPDPLAEWGRYRLLGLRHALRGAKGTVEAFSYRRPALSELVETGTDWARPFDLLAQTGTASSYFSSMSARVANELGLSFTSACQRVESWKSLGPLVDRILGDARTTAIVGSTDEAAVDVTEYLRARGIAVPGRISVAGFDDTDEASSLGITSYNLNNAAFAEAMLGHVLRAGRGNSATGRITEVSGFLVPRRSTGRTPHAAVEPSGFAGRR
jgi:hypothetical protein